MKAINEYALAGTLRSPENKQKVSLEVKNELLIPVRLIWIDFDGNLSAEKIFIIKAGEKKKIETFVGHFWIANSSLSGSFVTAIEVPSNSKKLSITLADLEVPNNIGQPPLPTQRSPIPADSRQIVIGVGESKGKTIIVREQFWRRTTDSFSILPNAERVDEIKTIIGVEESLTTLKSISVQLGTQLNLGWGPIQTSIASSLNAAGTQQHTVSLRNFSEEIETTRFVNPFNEAKTFFAWQLTNVYTWWEIGKKDAKTKLVNTLIMMEPPALFRPDFSK